MIKNLVLNGGSINGIAHLGAIRELNKKGFLKNLQSVSASSSGTLVGVFAILNKDLDKTIDEFVSCDFKKLKNINIKNLNKWGLDDGKKFHEWIEYLLYMNTQNKNITFEELYKINPILFTTTATNLNNMKTEYLILLIKLS